MKYIKRFSWILPIFMIVLVWDIFQLTNTSEGKIEVSGDDAKELVVTISSTDLNTIAEGDSLRKSFKFNEAVEVYQNVLNTTDVDVEVKAEAEYNIGLCKTWQGKFDEADVIFRGMLEKYPDDGKAKAYAEYCIAWVEIQKRDYYGAIARLENILENKTCEDTELYARAQFQIGRIYQSYLGDWEKAKEPFRKVVANYPNAKILSHPFLKKYKNVN